MSLLQKLKQSPDAQFKSLIKAGKLRILFAFLYKDFTDSLRNKTVIGFLVIPVILSFIFSLVFSEKDYKGESLGVISGKDLAFYEILNGSKMFILQDFESEEQAFAAINKGIITAFITVPEGLTQKIKKGENCDIQIFLNNSGSPQGKIIELQVTEILKMMTAILSSSNPSTELSKYLKNKSGSSYYIPYSGNKDAGISINTDYINTDSQNQTGQMISTWILFTLIGGIMLVSSSFIEERETKTLKAIMTTPVDFKYLIMGKVFLGIVLTLTASYIILLLNKGLTGNNFILFCTLILGSFLFSLTGVTIGVLSPSQTNANTVHSILFIILFMPALMAETSKIMHNVSVFLPSYYLLCALNKSMIPGGRGLGAGYDLLILAIFILAIFFTNIFLISKKRGI